MPSHRMRATAVRGAPHRPCSLHASVSDSAISVAPAKARSLVQRRSLLAGTMLAGMVLFTAVADIPALADGGKGGSVGATPGGAGGPGFNGGCCARAASGHAVAAPPSSVMNRGVSC